MYDRIERIRYSEADSSGRLSMCGLLRLFQDCGYFHAADRGLARKYTEDTGCTWYLLSWHIQSFRMPEICETVKISTGVYGIAGSLSKKALYMYSAGGELLAAGDTLWVYMNTKTQKPEETPRGLWHTEDNAERCAALPAVTRRISVPCGGTRLAPQTVDDYLTDTNGHANNVKLTELAMELAGMRDCCAALRTEFGKQAPHGSTIIPEVARIPDGTAFTVFRDTSGSVLSLYEFAPKGAKLI